MKTLTLNRRLGPAHAISPQDFDRFTSHPPQTLQQAVECAIDGLEDEILEPVAPLDAGPSSLTRAVLALLTICYARQVYGSHDVSRVAKRDPAFGRLSGTGFPDANVIRRFRAANQPAVQRCLVAALRFLAQQRVSSGALTKVNDAQLATEAGRRIIMAAFTDSLELEDAVMECPSVEFAYLVARNPT